jgi:hypothetical protein
VVMVPAVAGSQKKGRVTRYINMRQANNLMAACAFAEAIGCRLNVSIDVFWMMFLGWEEDAKRLAKSQQRLSKWFVRRGFTLTMIWVREIGANGALHTHILLHVPPWLMESGEFEIAFERSFEPEGGATHEKAILIQPAYAPEGKLRYMLKGISRRDAKRFRVRASPQGEIEGKRVGCTENIGARARARRDATITNLDAASMRSERRPFRFPRIFKPIASVGDGVAASTTHTEYGTSPGTHETREASSGSEKGP